MPSRRSSRRSDTDSPRRPRALGAVRPALVHHRSRCLRGCLRAREHDAHGAVRCAGSCPPGAGAGRCGSAGSCTRCAPGDLQGRAALHHRRARHAHDRRPHWQGTVPRMRRPSARRPTSRPAAARATGSHRSAVRQTECPCTADGRRVGGRPDSCPASTLIGSVIAAQTLGAAASHAPSTPQRTALFME